MSGQPLVKQQRRYGIIERVDSGSGPGKLQIGTASFAALLGEVDLEEVCGVLSGGRIKLNNFPKTVSGLENGSAAAARLVDSDDNVIKSGLTVGLTNADIILESLAFETDELVEILVADITLADLPYDPLTDGGGGDASAANQAAQITQETATATALGAPANSSATSDTGTFSLISLTKRLAEHLTNIVSYTSRLLSSAGPKAAGAAAATTAFQIGGTYNATPPTVADTQEVGLQVDATGRLKVNDDTTVSKAKTTALAASLVAKASAGTLVGVFGYNNSASDQYIQIHDAASLPGDTAVPEVVFKVFAGDNFFWVPPKPYPFETGIVVCNSSTVDEKTIGSADCWFNVEYY